MKTMRQTVTVGVLAGAYRGKDFEARMRTHLMYLDTNTAVCRKSINVCPDESEQTTDRPTCPKCAAKWDKIQEAK